MYSVTFRVPYKQKVFNFRSFHCSCSAFKHELNTPQLGNDPIRNSPLLFTPGLIMLECVYLHRAVVLRSLTELLLLVSLPLWDSFADLKLNPEPASVQLYLLPVSLTRCSSSAPFRLTWARASLWNKLRTSNPCWGVYRLQVGQTIVTRITARVCLLVSLLLTENAPRGAEEEVEGCRTSSGPKLLWQGREAQEESSSCWDCGSNMETVTNLDTEVTVNLQWWPSQWACSTTEECLGENM